MKNRVKFIKKHLKENQSLKYQIMLFLMEEHKRARLGMKPFYGNYFGNDDISFDEKDWIKMCDLIEKSVSENHKSIITEMKTNMPIDEYIFSLMESENYCYNFENQAMGNCIIKNFKMTPEGHSYQYNGYMKSQDKSNKINARIQTWLVILTVGILFYYIGSWFIPNLNPEHFTLLLKYIENIAFWFKSNFFLYMLNLTKLSFILLVLILIYYSIFVLVLKIREKICSNKK